MHDFTEWAAGERTKTVNRPPDGHHREGIEVAGQADERAHLFFTADMISRYGCSESKGTAAEQDVLHGGVNTGATDPLDVGKLLRVARADVRGQ